MSDLLTVTGEQFMQESSWRTDLITRPASIDILLYNDSTDSISDTNNLADITTEPSGSSYARQSVSLDGSSVNITEDGSNNWEITFNQVSFDTSDSSQTVDGYGIVANFDATASTGGNNGDNLVMTGSLSQSYDLSNVDTLNVSNTGGYLQ